jgi:hypothetical protein
MNENLRQALLRTRLREQDVAATLGVDPKTVRRWIEGRVPYPANRVALADLLRASESELWPEINSPLSSQAYPEELVAVYPNRWAISRQIWAQFFASAEREIGILAYSALFLAEDTGLLRILSEKGSSGVRVRLALGDSASRHVAERGTSEGIGSDLSAKVRSAITLYRPLNSIPNIEIRIHSSSLYNSIYQADDQLLVNHHVYGIPAAYAPVFRLQRVLSDGMATNYLDSFLRIWSAAGPLA